MTVLALTSVIAQTQTQPAQWLRYTVKGEEFSVTLPVEPSMKTTEAFVNRVQKSRIERVLEAKAADLVYRIYVYENPKPRQSLKEFVDEQTAKSDLDLTFDGDLTVSKFSGKQYSSHDSDFRTTEQFFATEGHFYRFVVRGATADHTDAKQFFSSILLGKKQDGIQVLEGGNADALSGERVFLGKEVDTRARLISKPEPVYPDAAKNNHINGTVILKVVFAASGKVTNIRVVQGLPNGLTECAIEAARKIKFVPPSKEGKYVSMWMQLEYNFNLF
jgi:TonB family protein